SLAAKNLMEQFKGNRDKIFQEEAVNVFSIYIAPLFPRYRVDVLQNWTRQFGPPEDETGWVQQALLQLPALHHFIDIMTAADQQPTRKDNYHHFMDNEIMVAPLAYATVFVAKDRAIRDMLHKRTKILERTKCKYCDSF